MADQPGWRQLSCELGQVASTEDFYAPAGFRLTDHRGPTINETDGRRRTWAPPTCGCTRVKVWWFGGSTAWGWDQRDLYTIPSQLARLAWQHGIALDISNYGEPEYVLGQEVRQFAQLTVDEPPPDLVVFYDGANDLILQATQATEGDPADTSELQAMQTAFGDMLAGGLFLTVPSHPVTFTAAALPNDYPKDSAALVATLAKATMTRYQRNAALGRRVAQSIDRKVLFAFQPMLGVAPAAAAAPNTISPNGLRFLRGMVDAARPRFPAGQIDLTHSLDTAHPPVFTDAAHTTERGALMVAAALYTRIEGDLRQARDDAAHR